MSSCVRITEKSTAEDFYKIVFSPTGVWQKNTTTMTRARDLAEGVLGLFRHKDLLDKYLTSQDLPPARVLEQGEAESSFRFMLLVVGEDEWQKRFAPILVATPAIRGSEAAPQPAASTIAAAASSSSSSSSSAYIGAYTKPITDKL